MKTVLMSVTLVTTFVSAVASSQSVLLGSDSTDQIIDLYSPEAEPYFRAIHHGTQQIPDGIAFVSASRSMKIWIERDGPAAASYLARESGLSLAVAREVMALSTKAVTQYEADADAELKEQGCTNDGVQKVYGDAVYDLFEQMDDRREVIAAKHFESVKNQLDGNSVVQLQDFIEAFKENMTYAKPRHKATYQRLSRNGDTVLSVHCSS